MKCCFIGHRDSTGVETLIDATVRELIGRGVTEFYSGGMGRFDKLCEKAVKAAGGRIIFVPYNMRQVKETDKTWYDAVVCPFGKKPYSKFDIPNRNRWLVEHCDICLCYVYRDGGAKQTMDYAIKKQKRIVNLYCNGK